MGPVSQRRADRVLLWLVLPLVLIVFAGGLLPAGYAVVQSAFSADGGAYRAALTDRGLWISLSISLCWAAAATILTLVMGVLLATRLRRSRARRSRCFYLLVLVPWAIPAHIAVPLWRAMLYGDAGRSLFSLVTGLTIDLMNDPIAAFFATVGVAVWLAIPLVTLVIASARSAIPASITEAARIDGADDAQLFRYVTWPHLRWTATAVGILLFVRGLKEFTVVFLMTAGGPPLVAGITDQAIVGATTTLGLYLYELSMRIDDVGVMSAYSVLVSCLIGSIVLLWLRFRVPGSRLNSLRPVGQHRHTATGRFARRRSEFRHRATKGIGSTVTAGSWIASLLFGLSTVLALYLLIWMSASRIGTAFVDGVVPTFFGLGSYRTVIVDERLLRHFLNSFVLGSAVGMVTPLAALPAGWWLSQLTRSTRYLIIAGLQATIVAGGIHLLVPLYALATRMRMADTIIPLVVIYVHHAMPLSLLLISGRIPAIPRTLREAWALEGGGPVSLLARVVVPLALPVLVTVGIVAFLGAWNGYVAPMLFIARDARYPIAVKLAEIVGPLGSGRPRWNLFAAGSVVNLLLILGLLVRTAPVFRGNPLEEAAGD